MTQDSWNYDCTVGGDARAIAQEDWQRSRIVFKHGDRSLDGIVYTKESSFGSGSQDFSALLAPSNPGGVTVRIANGAALVNGYEYYNDADVDFDVGVEGSGFASATDLIVLRSTPATGLARLAYKKATAPSTKAVVTQTLVTWEIAIVEVVLDAGGVFASFQDVRVPALPKGAVIPLETAFPDAVGTFTFSSIPPFFSHLRTEWALSVNVGGGGVDTTARLTMNVNADVGASYYWRLSEEAAATTNTSAFGGTFFDLGLYLTNAVAAFQISNGTTWLNNYAPHSGNIPAMFTLSRKSIKNFGATASNTDARINTTASMWSNAGTDISSITYNMVTTGVDVPLFDATEGTRFTLYGIV